MAVPQTLVAREVRTGCAWKGGVQRWGSSFLEPIFLFRSMRTTQSTVLVQKWGQGVGKIKRGALKPPKDAQSHLLHFHTGPEEQDVHVHYLHDK